MSARVERDHIGIFGKMNSGKSSLLNMLSQQEASIVDDTPGTTADTKLIKQEIHGMGPVKFYDTAGIDETSALGEKKKRKVINVLKECDLLLLVIDPSSEYFQPEEELLSMASGRDKQLLVVYNLFTEEDARNISRIEAKIPDLRNYKRIKIKAVDEKYRPEFLKFILDNFKAGREKRELIPFVTKGEFYVLLIPMDEQSPEGRYLRPQSMTGEFITRKKAYPVSYRLDLSKAKSSLRKEVEGEKKKFHEFIDSFKNKPAAVISDSQAAKIMNDWLREDIMLTTFSIVMINYVSRGKLADFAAGIKEMKTLGPGDRVLIAEACNHSRIAEDIGTVQIPEYFKKKFPLVEIEHNFGREFRENAQLGKYSLVIHCGGCMISKQKMQARLEDLQKARVAYTNYGVFLSFINGAGVLSRVLSPWGIDLKESFFSGSKE